MATAVINPNMILLAREARGLTQTQLAQQLGTYKATISRLEHGETAVDETTLLALAVATKFPPPFFLQKGKAVPVHLGYRMRKKVPAKIITPIEAQMNIMRRHVQLVTSGVQPMLPALPTYAVTEKNTPAAIAALVRKKWNLPAGPLPNLCGLLEQQGIVCCHFDFDTDRVDSRTMLTDNDLPIIFLNRRLQGDRQRYSLAFELGHLIMHTYCTVPHQRDVTHEANLFAAAFLMPAKDIAADYASGITLPLLGELKLKWQQSMIALLYRADDIGLLTANQKRYLLQQFNNQKIRRREPPALDVRREQPRLFKQLLKGFCKQHGLSTITLATVLGLYTDELQLLYFTDAS